MNREDAKYLLSACRVGGQDAIDPQFREALEVLKIDPELAEWFAKEQAMDRRVAEKFASFPVPPDLKPKLLAARKLIPMPRWWRSPAWLMIAAACVVLTLTLALLSFRPSSKPQFADFRSYVGVIAGDKAGHLGLMSKDLAAVRHWLNSHDAPDDFMVPAGLNGLPSMGCRVLDWSGSKVSFVCFELGNRRMVHLFVADRGVMRGCPGDGSVEVVTLNNGITTLSWSDDQRAYVLAGHENEQQLRKLL